MRKPCPPTLPVAVPVAIMIALLAGAPVAGQTEVPADDWVPPRTADGQPDLQGTWNNTTITPFERRPGQPEFLTEEEAADAERRAIERRARANAPSTPRTELRVVERFTRIDENTIDWQATIEDPDVYTAPWTVAVPFRREPDYVIYEYACHEGNHAIEGVMGGQRAVERRAAHTRAWRIRPRRCDATDRVVESPPS